MKRCKPLCFAMLISLKATLAAFKAPSTTSSGVPTNVYTVLFVEAPGSMLSKEHPLVALMAAPIASTI